MAPIAAMILLNGCATATPKPIIIKEPICGTVEDWSEEDQERAADELLELLPIDSPVTWAMGSFIRMRDEARACREPKPAKSAL